MVKLNVIPSPQYASAVLANGKTPLEKLKTISISSELEVSAKEALKFLPALEGSEPEKADLIITTDKNVAEKFFPVDDTWFEKPNADEQGYIIKGLKGGKIIVFAHNRMGIMYAIATLLQLPSIEPEFEIKDYPDFRYRANKWLIWNETEVWGYDFGDGIEEYKKRIIRKLDMCLEYKVNMIFFDGWGADPDRNEHYKDLMRYFNREARKRGIYLIVGAYTTGYGLSAHKFGKHFGKVYKNKLNYPHGEEYACIGTSYEPARKFGTCLSNEAMMDDKLEELRNYVREVQPGALYLHNMDNHLIEQKMWLLRCEECRKRWPNDGVLAKDGMAGAFAEFFDRLNGALKGIVVDDYDSSRDLLIFNVSPGYMSDEIEDEEVEIACDFWKKVLEFSKVKENVFPTFREMYYNKNDERLRIADVLVGKIQGEGDLCVINFSGGGGFYTDKLFFVSSVFNYMFKGTDALMTCSGSGFQEPLQVFNAEYMWNCENSSFYNIKDVPTNYEEFMKLYHDCRFTRFRPEEIYKDGGMLDIICEKLYGKHAKAMAKFFKLCGENFECPVPYACNKETLSAGNNVNLPYRWDNELKEARVEKYIASFGQMKKLNNEAIDLLEGERSENPDIISYLDMLKLNTVLVSYWHEYLKLYLEADRFIKENIGNKEELIEKAEKGIALAQEEKKNHQERNFCTVDELKGALARREELLNIMEYNYGLIIKSLNTGKRIPDDREILQNGVWW